MATLDVKIGIGEIVDFDGEPVEIKSIILSPSGPSDPDLVCLVFARKKDGTIIYGKPDEFSAIEEEAYEDFSEDEEIERLKGT